MLHGMVHLDDRRTGAGRQIDAGIGQGNRHNNTGRGCGGCRRQRRRRRDRLWYVAYMGLWRIIGSTFCDVSFGVDAVFAVCDDCNVRNGSPCKDDDSGDGTVEPDGLWWLCCMTCCLWAFEACIGRLGLTFCRLGSLTSRSGEDVDASEVFCCVWEIGVDIQMVTNQQLQYDTHNSPSCDAYRIGRASLSLILTSSLYV